MKEIDYSKITDNPKVVELFKKRNEIENQITDIETMALVKYEFEVLGIDESLEELNQNNEVLDLVSNCYNCVECGVILDKEKEGDICTTCYKETHCG
jgi:hypothetical protein